MERARTVRWVGILAASGVAVLTSGLLVGRPGPGDTGRRLQAAPPRAIAARPPRASIRAVPELRAVDGRLGRGGTLGDALDRLFVPSELRAPLLAAIASRLDARRLGASTSLRALVGARGDWRSLGVRTEPERFLRVRISADATALEAEWVAIPVRTELRRVSGIVESSVAQALAHHPHGNRLTLGFADVFQWDVDLLVDPRPGDRVSLVYELRRLGDVPREAPPLGGQPSASGEVLEPGRIVAAAYAGRMASADAFWVATGEATGDYYDRAGRPLRKTFLKSPLNYRRISSRFSRARRNPVTRKVVPHHGVDYAAAPGTPVVASADGRIVAAGWDGALGRAVRIRHGSEFVTVYGHLRGFARGIRRGVEVRQNQVIGYVGSTGRATGPHLHYTVIRRGAAIDPLRMDNPPVEELEAARRPDLARAVNRFATLLGLVDGSTRLARGRTAEGAGPRATGS